MKQKEKIFIKLDSLEDAYSRFSADDDKRLDGEFVSHMVDRADDVSVKTDLEINIKLESKHSQEEKETFKKIFANHFSRRMKEEKRNILKKYIISSFMLLVGILLTIIFRVIPEEFFMFEFVVEIGAWVFIWEAVYVFAFNIPFSHTKNIYHKKLSKANIVYEEQTKLAMKNNKKTP